MLYYIIIGEPDFLRNVIASGKVAFHQINKCFVNVLIFHHRQNSVAGRMKCFRGPQICPADRSWRPLV